MERVETTFKCNPYPGKRQPRLRTATGALSDNYHKFLCYILTP